jgi:oligopeptide transport system substrate-binding protein
VLQVASRYRSASGAIIGNGKPTVGQRLGSPASSGTEEDMKLRFAIAATVAAAALLAGALTGTPSAAAADPPKAFRMIVGEPRSLDPNLVTDYSIYVNAQLFQPLARIDNSGKLTLLQAKSIEVGPDGRTWTITLNPDYKWSNGQPITAADWDYSWKRILDPKLGGEVASLIYDIENAEDYNKGKIADVSQVGIKATGDHTFQVVTTKVAPQFRAVMALTYLTPVPKALIEKVGEKWIAPENILSNGPYKLVIRKNDESIVMEANPYYGGKKPAIGRIEMTVASGDLCTAQLRAYEAGEVDFTTCVPPQDIPRVLKDATLGKELKPFPVAATVWVQSDNSHAPWNDKKVRYALAFAVDRKAVVAAATADTGHVADTLVPELIIAGSSADAIKGTVDDAKKLLADAGFPGGKGFPQFTLTASANRGQPIIAQALQQMWADNLGITATINVLEENAYRAWVKARKTEAYDLMLNQWYTDYADPTNWYGDLVIADYRNTHFQNAAFADLVKQANAEPDVGKRHALFLAANKILEAEQPYTALYNPTDLWLVKPNVVGLEHEGVLDQFHIGEASFK